MMKKNKFLKLCSLVLSICIIFTSLPFSVSAADDEGENVNQSLLEGEDLSAGEATANVTNADELEAALNAGLGMICIAADFELDRTFYVTANTVIYALEAHTLTRSENFGGDIFVIGENAEGVLCEDTVTLTLGDANETEENLLTIDGNKDNLTVDVLGSALFLTKKAEVNIYGGVTFQNHQKVGNEKTNGGYSVSYPARIGGSVAIVTGSAKMNIYGGNFKNNGVNTVADSADTATQGGVIYNYGILSIYGGTFEGNSAYFGGVFFNYRTMNIYKADIINNSATSLGGAIYMPNSGSAFTYIGDEEVTAEPTVTFRGNSSKNHGGAIYARNLLSIKNAVFEGNSSTAAYGGAIYASTIKLSIFGSAFTQNTAAEEGGALYISGSNSSEDILELTVSDTLFGENSADTYGGAVYLASSARAYFKGTDFLDNSASRGGAIYTADATLEIDEATISGNTASSYGGAMAIYDASTVVLNKISASENKGSSGGAIFVTESNFTLYNSEFLNNTATSAGGALNLNSSSVSNIYGTKFEGNTAGTNAGALAIYTNTTDASLYDCELVGNTASNYGGGIHTTTKSQVYLYNITAKNNSAKYGGFMYETAAGTVVTLSGLTVSGNTASTGGAIIWGNTLNADLYIDKSKYVDLDEKGDWDTAYWAEAIKNKLTVIEQTIEIPSYTDYDKALITPVPPIVTSEVETSAQLTRALRAGHPVITIMADFEIDRTFYIGHNVKIKANGNRTLTRKADFAGDIFVVGETSNGVLTESEVEFILGDEEKAEENTLTIDGNKANTSVDVTGSALFLTKMAIVNVYGDITFQNHKKVGNEKTNGKYTVSYPARIGGSVAIVTGSATLNIYGGNFKSNEINTVADDNNTAIQGGVIYNYGTTNIYGGTFEGNTGYFGGVFFNYRTMNIYAATFKTNTATSMGGVMYMPNSGAAFTYIGEENDVVVPGVVFEGNTSKNVGGAIYAKNKITLKNATFKNNSSTADNGGAVAATNIRMSIENCIFESNSSTEYGGAVYVSGANTADEVELSISNSVFSKNSANRAGAVYVASDAETYIFKTNFSENTATYGGVAFADAAKLEINGSLMTGNTATYAGCIEVYTDANVLLNNITATENEAKYGGVIYSKSATLAVYNSNFNNNTATSTGGAFNINELTTANIYASKFNGNSATSNGGAMGIYSNLADIMLHGCEFEDNTAGGFGGAIHTSTKSLITMYGITAKNNTAGNGGFLYETPAGTVVKIAGLTVSGNTATVGGPIIWGNTLNAKLYMDTSKYTDLDHTGAYDDAYWKTAIVNKLTVYYDYTAEIPKYLDYGNEPYDQMADAVDVKNSVELEAAINAGTKHIRIVADFELDRTFYITGETVIFSTIERTLTRAKDFAGEIFVVGEDKDGKSALLLGNGAKLTLGNPYSIKENLLTIDGNKDNMEVNVDGTVLFICNSSKVYLYSNVTIANHKKVANNSRIEKASYGLSASNRIGGPVAIISSGSLNIYDSSIKNNSCNLASSELAGDEQNCVNGGAIYSEGTVNIYGGTFSGNSSGRGGFCYDYGILKVIAGTFEGNSSGTAGGAIYVANTAGSRFLVGTAGQGLEKVVFKNNSSGTAGGAVYAPYYMACNIYGNTEFIGNTSKTLGGAIVSYGQMTARGTLFSENTAKSGGGAVYISNPTDSFKTRFVVFENCIFEKNSSPNGGALQLNSSDSSYPNGALVTVSNCEFNENTSASGGAINSDRKSELTVLNSNFTLNSSTGEAGAIYAASNSIINIKDTNIVGSSAEKAGGAISARSVYLTLENSNIDQSSSGTNGGAIYVSYISASDINTHLNMTDSSITNSTAGGYGGAIYATKHTVENEHRILNIENSLFEGNTANDDGGALHIQSKVDAYFKEVTFKNNTATTGEGGAISTPGAIIEIDTATFEGNTAKSLGGAISLNGAATATLNNITATSNSTNASGGFMYTEGATLKLYNSNIKGNIANTNGGGISFYSGAVSEVYNTTFEKNSSGANGGALTVYTGGTETIVNNATFKENSAASGGVIYTSGSSDLKLYNITATNNTATKGGFMYETTTGTVVKLNGVTLSGNTATEGGPIVWGNSTGAVLNINKANYTDLDNKGAYDSAYWSAAIYNKLKVSEISEKIPTYADYVPKTETEPNEPVQNPEVSVDAIFELAEKQTNEGNINSTYGKFPKLENKSNFMSKGQTKFDNINGETVTVDSFVYPPYATADNVNVGQGLLIFQAMQYKKANPTEEVYIDASSYRFSVQCAVNINRNSRYFGYMRNLSGVQYDEYGFVRISYLLICAAKMGIHVNIIGHVDGYPVTSSEPKMVAYFTNQYNDPCDSNYVTNGVVSDYLKFTKVDWTLSSDGNKGGTDMMHTKLCAVSHYLDKDGVAHKNAVFTSSANLDGINSKGYNGNWALQTATIISDHEGIYNASVNYLRLMAQYPGQEELYEFQDLMNRLNTEQSKLISEGKESEIPKEERIVYLGTENDDVFEMYFTPMGGDILSWDELNNPYCKYLRKMYNSEDHISFIWTTAEYASGFPLGQQMEEIIAESFHKNKNPNNYIYVVAQSFNTAPFGDLAVGQDIGFKSFNEKYVGGIHNKDMLLSYTENGQRYFVSILNSCNIHGGSMYYQSNFALVIKEKTCSEDSVFSTVAGLTSPPEMVTHDFSDEEYTVEPTETEHGYKYHICNLCGQEKTIKTLHIGGEWVVLSDATTTKNGVKYKTCTICDTILETAEIALSEEKVIDVSNISGKKFTSQASAEDVVNLSATPHTIEAVLMLPKTQINRAGVIFGNYVGGSTDQLNLEVAIGGKLRLFYISAGKREDCVFNTDIRSAEPIHLAVTLDGLTATLYINGQVVETKTLSTSLPTLSGEFRIGGDNRKGNSQYFKGRIYSIGAFSDVRTQSEIKTDLYGIFGDEENLLCSRTYTSSQNTILNVMPYGKKFNAQSLTKVHEILGAPKTIEAVIKLSKDLNNSAGVIVGNYGDSQNNQINLEVNENGRLKLYTNNGAQENSYLFSGDIRSEKITHIAVTFSGLKANLYVDGIFTESIALDYEVPVVTEGFVIGGDNRPNNSNYFKGTIYSVNMFNSVRTADEIKQDTVFVDKEEQDLVYSAYFTVENNSAAFEKIYGKTFTENDAYTVGKLASTPKTFEAVIQVDKDFIGRAGVILGNYQLNTANVMTLESYTSGKLRLFYTNKNRIKADVLFRTDVRSYNPIHLALTVDGLTATLYINGEAVETQTLPFELPEMTNDFKVGGDNREGNTQYFKGKIYSVNMFNSVRTADEINQDIKFVNANDSKVLFSKNFDVNPEKSNEKTVKFIGKTFAADDVHKVGTLAKTPHTIEAVVQLNKDLADRGGVIFGNYVGGDNDQISLEAYTNGNIRLFYVSGGNRASCVFDTDIRSDKPVHIAVTVDGLTATLYINGVAAGSQTLPFEMPNTTNYYKVGGDNRGSNTQYFKGTIYSVGLYGDARTPEEVKQDVYASDISDNDLLWYGAFATESCLNNEHIEGKWVETPVDSETINCIRHKYCTKCGKELKVGKINKNGQVINSNDFTADGFKPEKIESGYAISDNLSAAPLTFEAQLQLDPEDNSRAGVVVGNYDGSTKDQINIEIYEGGVPRLYYKVNKTGYTYLFKTDIRSKEATHIAITIDGLTAKLYVNGALKESIALTVEAPKVIDAYYIGADARATAPQYFNGTIYTVSIFSDVRTAEEIALDRYMVTSDADNLLYNKSFVAK